VVSLLLVLTAATGLHSACHATCERDITRCMATQTRWGAASVLAAPLQRLGVSPDGRP